jgi:chemotaxis signal transduction protein
MIRERNKQETYIAVTADAWVLPLRRNLVVAVGALEMMHIIPETPELFEIPRAPSHCRHVIVWEDEILPLTDLAILLLGETVILRDTPERLSTLAAAVVYQAGSGQRPQRGALLLNGVPGRSQVNDEQVCELPTTISDWRGLAISCFRHPQYGRVPILDLTHLFTAKLHEDPFAAT